MPIPSSRLRPIVIGLIVLVLLSAGLGVYWFFFHKPTLPGRDSPVYRKYVEAFQVGVAAIDIELPADSTKEEDKGIRDLSYNKLSEAIETIPGEPAAWANRGLWLLRKNRKEAESDLREAERLAPENPDIQKMLGLLDDRSGKFSSAIDRFRKVHSKNPNDLETLHALDVLLSKEVSKEADEERLKLLNQALAIQPNNVVLLYQKGKLAAQMGDRPALKQVVEAYNRMAPEWSGLTAKEARERLAKLNQVSDGPLPGDVDPVIDSLDVVLKPELFYSRHAHAAGQEGVIVVDPLQQFVLLPPMRASPSPPDTGLEFLGAEPVTAGTWNVALPVWLKQDDEPAIFVANGREVRQATGDAPALTFPGGPDHVAPSAHGILAVDWQNHFRTSFVFAGAGGLRFYQQEDNGQFKDVTDKTGLDAATLNADYFGVWAADYEIDGDLDIIAAPRKGPPLVLRNNGDGTFKVRKPFAGVENVRAFVWADLDNDGAADAVFLDSAGKVHVFANERAGQFRERTLPDGLGKALALAVADVTDDGVFDLLILRDDGGIQRFSDKDKGKSWETAEVARSSNFPTGQEPGSYRLLTADLDNNGGLDLIAAGADGSRIWLSDEQGKFAPQGSLLAENVMAAVDLSKDGRLDLLAISKEGAAVRRINKGTKNYHWQILRPLALDRRTTQLNPYERMNSFAIGSEAEIRAGLLIQKQLVTAPVLHFGLGEQPRASVTRFVWTTGEAQNEFNKASDQAFTVLQRLNSSCPFLFTWDGHAMCFVTDFMWSTPLGLHINGQANANFSRTEEWVKIRGDQLRPRDGKYNVRVTADLWETHFFDHLSLIVVDHPPDTEIYADERFARGPAEAKVFMTGPPQPIAHATDDQGRDVTETVRSIDGKYLDFRLGKYQGLALDHFVEVDLGDDAPTEGPLVLLASGWIHPTDSSINVAIEQRTPGQTDRPFPILLEIPDGKGGWKVAKDDIGFPAGKNKTILIRLDGLGGDVHVARRFRLRTNMEIYWDALRYARVLDEGQAKQQPLAPETAELRYRGVGQLTPGNGTSPEVPLGYDVVHRKQCWRDLIGYYTRYGDVRELLAEPEGRYVIMNAGDEIALTFQAPTDPPAGWKRDYIWVSDGWTKDGNMNTSFSKTVLPMPHRDLKSYDTPPGRLEDDPVYQRFPDDWKKYHTRYVTPSDFERGLRMFHLPLR
jgi:hypothetical protein